MLERFFLCVLILLTVVSVEASSDIPEMGQKKYSAKKNYERLVRPVSRTVVEHHLLRVVRRWGRRNKVRIKSDSRLDRVARILLRQQKEAGLTDVPVKLSLLREWANRLGNTDGEFAAISLRGDARQVVQLLQKKIQRQVINTSQFSQFNQIIELGPNRVGVADRKTDKGHESIIVFSRRLINLLPFSRFYPLGKLFKISGRVPKTSHIRNLKMVVGRVNGSTYEQSVSIKKGLFTVSLKPQMTPGIINIQFIIERGSGPEVAAQFPLGIGETAFLKVFKGEGKYRKTRFPLSLLTQNTSLGADNKHNELSNENEPIGTDDPEAELINYIYDIISSQQLALPRWNQKLYRVAKKHAKDMVDNNYFAHRSQQTGDVSDRLRRERIIFERVVENIGKAREVKEIANNWLVSPAHRANIMDEHVSTFALSVIRNQGLFYAVLIMAKLPTHKSEQELTRNTLQYINNKRAKQGKELLVLDDSLQEVAYRHSQMMGMKKSLIMTGVNGGTLVDQVFDECDVETVAAEVFLAPSFKAVAISKYMGKEFSKIGVGVFQRMDKRLWLTVIYAR